MRNRQVFLRKFEPSDLAEVLRIEHLSFAIDPWPKSKFDYCFKRHPNEFIVAEINSKVVGYVIGRIRGKKASIGSVAVDPKFRREGTGYQLMAYILNYFKEKKIKQVKVEVRTTNRGSIKLFQSNHFKIIKTLPKYYPDGGDAFLMEKKLG